MFALRENMFATDDELDRQATIWKVIRHAQNLTSNVEFKTAAVCNHPDIDPILRCKIFKRTDELLELCDNDLTKLYKCSRVRDSALKYLNDVGIAVGDTLQLTVKPPRYTYSPHPLRLDIHASSVRLSYMRTDAPQTLHDFERLAWNNVTSYPYYENTTFAVYVYNNLKSDVDRLGNTLDDDPSNAWKIIALDVIKKSNMCNNTCSRMFYDNSVTVRGKRYDVSLVPKYDVRRLRPIKRRATSASFMGRANDAESDENLLNYHKNLDPRNTRRVPVEFSDVFLTFPFKDGHYINVENGGYIEFLNMDRPSVDALPNELADMVCSIDDIEGAIMSACENLKVDDVIACAVYAESIQKQGVLLLILRNMLGDHFMLQQFHVNLPTIDEVASWTSLVCERRSDADRSIILPRWSSSVALTNRCSRWDDDTTMLTNLISDIARESVSELDVSFLCSNYLIPEHLSRAVYERVVRTKCPNKRETRLYVFATILLQQYPNNVYWTFRCSLKPQFSADNDASTDIQSRYRSSVREYVNYTPADRFGMYTEHLIKPTDTYSSKDVCPPYKCNYMYEFVDDRMRDFAQSGDIDMDHSELAAYCALLLSIPIQDNGDYPCENEVEPEQAPPSPQPTCENPHVELTLSCDK